MTKCTQKCNMHFTRAECDLQDATYSALGLRKRPKASVGILP